MEITSKARELQHRKQRVLGYIYMHRYRDLEF
jgi:hypothetical protein